MDCKFCNEEMELDSREGISYSETSLYICVCGTEVRTYENSQEDEWERWV